MKRKACAKIIMQKFSCYLARRKWGNQRKISGGETSLVCKKYIDIQTWKIYLRKLLFRRWKPSVCLLNFQSKLHRNKEYKHKRSPVNTDRWSVFTVAGELCLEGHGSNFFPKVYCIRKNKTGLNWIYNFIVAVMCYSMSLCLAWPSWTSAIMPVKRFKEKYANFNTRLKNVSTSLSELIYCCNKRDWESW